MSGGASGIVLAGGQSRRMGRDKLPLTVGGVPIIHRICEALAGVCDEILVVGSEGHRVLPEGVRVVDDLRCGDGLSGAGPLAGLEAGLSEAGYSWAFVAAGDMPFVSPDLISETLRLLRAGEVHAVVPRVDGRLQPLCAAYSRESLGYVGVALDEGVRAVRELVERLPEVTEVTENELRRFGEPELLLMNVNSPEELSRARRLAGEECNG